MRFRFICLLKALWPNLCLGLSIASNAADQIQEPATTSTLAVQTEMRGQTIRAGDILAVGYVFEPPDPSQPYLIEPADKLRIRFLHSPLLTGDYVVQPEGFIYLDGTDRRTYVIDRTTSE